MKCIANLLDHYLIQRVVVQKTVACNGKSLGGIVKD